jgi:hypothetical protein
MAALHGRIAAHNSGTCGVELVCVQHCKAAALVIWSSSYSLETTLETQGRLLII